MNNKVVYTLYQIFLQRGFACMRFNFRGVGRSQGSFARGEGELSDAAAALDVHVEGTSHDNLDPDLDLDRASHGISQREANALLAALRKVRVRV